MKIYSSKLVPILAAIAAIAMLPYRASATPSTTVNLTTDGIGWFTHVNPSDNFLPYEQNMVSAYNADTSETISGVTYTVMNYDTWGTLGAPTSTTSNVSVTGGPTSYSFSLGAGGYAYLVADWDGPTGGEAVYDISGLTGTITVNDTGDGGFSNPNAGLSNYWLVDGPAGSVPDNFTIGSLCSASGYWSIGLVRRKRAFRRLTA